MCVREPVSRIWPMPANGYMTAPRTTSTCRLTLCGTSKPAVTPSGSWIEQRDLNRSSNEVRMPSVSPQPVVAGLTRAAIFLVVTVNPGPECESAVRSLCGDLAALLRAVGFRDLQGQLSCVMAFGSNAWDRVFGVPK